MIQFQEYLQSDYPGFASFIDTIIKPIFGDNFKAVTNIDDMIDCLNEDPEELEFYDEIAKSTDESLKSLAEESGLERVLKLGTIQVQGDTRPIYVYDITVSKRRQLSRNRKGIQQLIARTLNNQSGAFMLFHYGDADWEWRFSYKFVGKDREDTTNSKRFTYLLGRDQVCKTAAMRFTNLLNKKGKIAFDDITEAFSVEKVSKEFFDHYRSIYADIICYVTGKRMVKSGSKWEEKQEHEPNAFIMQQFAQFAEPEKSVRDYVKKLMGRLVFLQFIQKKGWLGVPADDNTWSKGDKDFVQNLFARCENKDTFIDDVLEPLFADINNRREGDMANTILGEGIKVPYLNGGLFEKDVEDDTAFPLPAHYMDEMLNEFFSAYNFTIDENDPSDAEVGVDPEMLGRVFENLLEDNKDKGAFYTPKEIVQYMCRESLIAYLQTDIEDETTKESIREFVTTHEISALKSSEVFKVDKKLREVKICDPAIGSGAFPMGLLKELFDCRMAIEGSEGDQTPAEIKKDIIQNSIYGVDIEKGAVDIARLRFWLSLIIDEQTPHALPNMDFKIMQGNSLLEQYKGVPLDDIYDSSRQMMLAFDEETTARMLLKEHMYSYFNTEDHDKKAELLHNIDNAVKSLVKAKTLGNPKVSAAIDALDLRNNQEFFLWHTWFNDVLADKKDAKGKTINGSGGFDIVIGNPPYIRRTSLPDSIKSVYEQNFKSAIKQYDIYLLFIEFGLNILKDDGHLCFINPIRFFNSDYGVGCRKYIASKHRLTHVIDISQLPVFENASTYPCILQINKASVPIYEFRYAKPNDIKDLCHIDYILLNNKKCIRGKDCQFIISFDNDKDAIIRKIDSIKTNIGDLYSVARGLPNSKVNFNLQQYKALKSTQVQKYCNDQNYTFVDTNNYQIFKNEMIIMPRTVKVLNATIKPQDIVLLDRIYYLTPIKTINDKYVLGVLNSKLINYWFSFYYDSTRVRGNYFDLNGNQIKSIPIVLAPISTQNQIATMVDSILRIKQANPNANTSAIEDQIDRIVYNLYGLTETEITKI